MALFIFLMCPPLWPQQLLVNGFEGALSTEAAPGLLRYDFICLFTAGKNYRAPGIHWKEFADWVADPRHSCVNDGYGGILILTHPSLYFGAHNDFKDYYRYLSKLDLARFTGIDITYMGSGPDADSLWDRLLVDCYDQGRPFLFGFGADDHGHFKSWSHAWLDTLSEAALKRAFRTGAFYASNGPSIDSIRCSGNSVRLYLPEASDVVWIKGGGAIVKRESRVREAAYTLNPTDGTTLPRSARYLRVRIEKNGRQAWTNPFRVLSTDSLVNPYAGKGQWHRTTTHNHSDCTTGKPAEFVQLMQRYSDSGYTAAFHTPYGYWVQHDYPFPIGKRPLIRGITPDRASVQEKTFSFSIIGDYFSRTNRVTVGTRTAEVTRFSACTLTVRIKGPFAAGTHDVRVVDTVTHLADCLDWGFSVQDSVIPGAWTSHTPANAPLPNPIFYSIAAGKKGIYAGSNYGLCGLQTEPNGSKSWQIHQRIWPRPAAGYQPDKDLGNDVIYGVAVDGKDNTWLATYGGVHRLDAQGTWDHWTKTSNLWPDKKNHQMNRIAVDGKGEVWATTLCKAGIFHFNGKGWSQILAPAIPSNEAGALFVDRDDHKWFAIKEMGLLEYDGKGWRRYSALSNGFCDDNIMAITEDRKGNLWLGMAGEEEGAGGLSCWNKKSSRNFTPKNSPLPQERVFSLLCDSRGNIWAGTAKGVARIDERGEWKVFNTVNSGLVFDFVYDMCEDSEGHVWFATPRGIGSITLSTLQP